MEETQLALSDHIEVNVKVMRGRPVIRGARIPVELILCKLGRDTSEKDLMDAYPQLKRAQHRNGDIIAKTRYPLATNFVRPVVSDGAHATAKTTGRE